MTPRTPYYPPVRLPYNRAPAYRLYSPVTVMVAAFLGFPIAGFFLIGANFRAMGRSGAAVLAWLGGFAMTAVMVLPVFLMDRALGTAIGMTIGVFGTYGLAAALQGDTYKRHIQAGGLPAPGWKVVVVVGSVLVCFFAAVAGLAWLADVTEPPAPVTVGNVTVHPDYGVNEWDTRMAAQALQNHPTFSTKPRQVGLEKTKDGHAVVVILKPEYLNDPRALESCARIGRILKDGARLAGPWTVRVRDQQGNLHRVFEP